jgi:hypothetical protein
MKPMGKITITTRMVEKHLKKMKNGKAPGLDGLKTEIYKELVKSNKCIEKLAECLNKQIEGEEIPKGWKKNQKQKC